MECELALSKTPHPPTNRAIAVHMIVMSQAKDTGMPFQAVIRS